MSELDQFYRFANDLRYSFSNYEFANKKRLRAVHDSKKWYQLQCQADRRFVLRMIRKIEAFEIRPNAESAGKKSGK